MQNRPLRPLLLIAAASSALALVAACSDEQGSGDDPLPIVPTRCAIYWARENPIDASLDFFAVDMPIAAWSSGTGSYGGPTGAERDGTFAYRSPDGSLTLAQGVGVTTSGEFVLGLENVDPVPGDDITFTDTTPQILVDARILASPPQVGTAGNGSFGGVWSALEAETSSDITWGPVSSTVTILYMNSSITLGGSALGGMSSYAQCYDADAAFAPVPLSGGRIFHQIQTSTVSSGTRHGKGSR